MVATEVPTGGSVTQPETVPNSTPSDIIPSSWTAAGTAFEWTRVKVPEDRVSSPPPELIREFLEIVGDGSVLGLSLALDPLPEGQIWGERLDRDSTQQILEIQPAEHWVDAESTAAASWKVVTSSSDGSQVETSLIACGFCPWSAVDHKPKE
jgi:hypothetical protein